MIKSVKARTPVLVLILFVFGIGNVFAQTPKVVVIPLGGWDGPVCCRVNYDGSLVAGESHRQCNADSTETQMLGAGRYEIDFLSPLTDVRPRVKMLTIDDRDGSGSAMMSRVAERSGDISAVYVEFINKDGTLTSAGYNICLF